LPLESLLTLRASTARATPKARPEARAANLTTYWKDQGMLLDAERNSHLVADLLIRYYPVYG
jgi:hypothetical protein